MVGVPKHLVAVATCMQARVSHRVSLTVVAGVVDFALLFVANYGNARGKKYNDPNDLAHSVDMLREVLGQVRGGGHSLSAAVTPKALGLPTTHALQQQQQPSPPNVQSQSQSGCW